MTRKAIILTGIGIILGALGGYVYNMVAKKTKK